MHPHVVETLWEMLLDAMRFLLANYGSVASQGDLFCDMFDAKRGHRATKQTYAIVGLFFSVVTVRMRSIAVRIVFLMWYHLQIECIPF